MTSKELKERLGDNDGVYIHSIYAKAIISSLALLESLEANGVDNWEGYDKSIEDLL